MTKSERKALIEAEKLKICKFSNVQIIPHLSTCGTWSYYAQTQSVHSKRLYQSFGLIRDAEKWAEDRSREIQEEKIARETNKAKLDRDRSYRGSPKPSLRVCAICGCEVPDPWTERRPTGKDGKMQTWAYCDECYSRFVLRESPYAMPLYPSATPQTEPSEGVA